MIEPKFLKILNKYNIQILPSDLEKELINTIYEIKLDPYDYNYIDDIISVLSLLTLNNFQQILSKNEARTINICPMTTHTIIQCIMMNNQDKNTEVIINRLSLFKENNSLNLLFSPQRVRLIVELLKKYPKPKRAKLNHNLTINNELSQHFSHETELGKKVFIFLAKKEQEKLDNCLKLEIEPIKTLKI